MPSTGKDYALLRREGDGAGKEVVQRPAEVVGTALYDIVGASRRESIVVKELRRLSKGLHYRSASFAVWS